jgi:DNA-binding LytR/AlgR family response regulator
MKIKKYMKLNCLIVDDEPLALEVIENYVQRFPNLQLVGKCRSASTAAEVLRQQPVDLLFLDIQMPDVSGLEFAKTLGKLPLVVFTTASREFAVQSYEAFAIDYLVKPISFEKFLKAVHKAFDRYDELEKLKEGPQHKTLLIKADNRTYPTDIGNILFVESIRDHVVIHLSDGSGITSYTAISALESQLPKAGFARIHRSYLISVNHLTSFSSSEVEIGGHILPIGRTYKEEVDKRLQSGDFHSQV